MDIRVAAAGALIAVVGMTSGCSASPDKLHDEAIKQCQESLLDRMRDPESAQFDDLAANGGEPNENNPEKYSYGVEGKLRGKNGFGAMTLSNIMCLATYDTTTKTWDVFAETY